MSKPVLVFIPGAWHSPEGFDTIISKPTPLGYKCIGLPLQAVLKQPAVKDLQPDIDALREVVMKESDAGNDIVVVGHSWGGLVVTGALDGLGKVQREQEGKSGGVFKIAYLCAFAPLENVSLIDAQGGQIPDFYDVKEPWVTVKGPEQMFYHDLSAEQAAYWSSKLAPHSYATKFVGVPSAAWRAIPSSNLICEDDRAIPVFVQEAMVKACQDGGAQMQVERILCSHSPFLSQPDATVAFLRCAAGEHL